MVYDIDTPCTGGFHLTNVIFSPLFVLLTCLSTFSAAKWKKLVLTPLPTMSGNGRSEVQILVESKLLTYATTHDYYECILFFCILYTKYCIDQ